MEFSNRLIDITESTAPAWRQSTLEQQRRELRSPIRPRDAERIRLAIENLETATDAQITAHVNRRNAEERDRRLANWQHELRDRPRYADCSLDNFEATHAKQGAVVNKLREYCEAMPTNSKAGRNVIFAGNCGTGKDHLMFALLRHARLELGITIPARRYIGPELAMTAKTWEPPQSRAPLELAMFSDPVLPGSEARFYYEQILYRIIDDAYNRRNPVWATMNAASRQEMEIMIGPALADRLLHNALVAFCDWPSYRRRPDEHET